MKYKYETGQWVYFMRDTGMGHDVSYGKIVNRFESQDERYVSRMDPVGWDRNRPAYQIMIFKNMHESALENEDTFVFTDLKLDDNRREWFEYEFNIVEVAPPNAGRDTLHSRMMTIYYDFQRGFRVPDMTKHMTSPFIVSVNV